MAQSSDNTVSGKNRVQFQQCHLLVDDFGQLTNFCKSQYLIGKNGNVIPFILSLRVEQSIGLKPSRG